MKAVGYLCLFAAIGAAAYFLFWTDQDTLRVLGFAGLGALAGVSLVIAERATEARVRAATEIDAATQRATTDAASIRALGQEIGRFREDSAQSLRQVRKDVEQIGKCAAEAKLRSDELVEFAKIAKEAQARLGDLSDFNMLITRANSDDREAFDELAGVMARNENETKSRIAQRVVFSLLADQRLYVPLSDEQWARVNFAPHNASLAEYTKFISASSPDLAAQAIIKLRSQERFSRRERFMMLANLIQHTKSIRVLEAACEAIGEEARIRKNILAWREYLTWWHANEARYQ